MTVGSNREATPVGQRVVGKTSHKVERPSLRGGNGWEAHPEDQEDIPEGREW